MTDKSPSADSLVTEPAAPPPAKVEGTAIDPAAHIDPAAASLDPAKVKPPKAKRPRAARKLAPAARSKKRDAAATAVAVQRMAAGRARKAAAAHGGANRDAGKAAYAAAVAHEVESFAKLPEGASLDLRLADDDEFVDGAIEGVCQDIQPAAQGATYVKDVNIGPDGPAVRVSEAWLIATTGEAVRCPVGPLTGGNGFHAKIPAGHLKF